MTEVMSRTAEDPPCRTVPLSSVSAARRSSPWRQWTRRLRHFGVTRYCPVCRSHLRRFVPFSYRGVTRPEARCPVCYALERHRFVALFFKQKTDLFDGRPKRLLHIAPEIGLARALRRGRSIDYLSADFDSPLAMVRMDLTDIQYPANSFDVIVSISVLVEIPDDRRAMAELCRVLKPGGWALLYERTEDGTTLDDPQGLPDALAGAARRYHQYGRDYSARLSSAGFDVTVHAFADGLAPPVVRRMGLGVENLVYLCRKGSAAR